MARQKSYDREEAVIKATNAFREHGYQNLGIRAIEELVGIGRFAIRTDFDGKEGLFTELVIQPIREADDISALEGFFERSASEEYDARLNHGCLLVNTMIETPTYQYPEFNAYTQPHFDSLKEAVFELVNKAKINGTVKESVNATHAAEFINGAIISMNVMNRDANNIKGTEGYADMVLATIASWKTNAK
jgi:TetR/AcrR family transcriptional repressor of nem operon